MPSLPGRSAKPATAASPMEEEAEETHASFMCPQCGANLKVEVAPDDMSDSDAATELTEALQ